MSDQNPFGPFTWENPCWMSGPVPVPLFAGAAVRIQVFSEENVERVLSEDEITVLQRFFALPQSRGAEIIPHLWRYYQDMWASVGPPDIPKIADASTIWDHVHPRFVSPDQDEDGIPYVIVEALCDWEIEHGLQLVLQQGTRRVRVSDSSGHLTDGRAWGKRFLDSWMADPARTLPVRSSDELSSARG